MTFPKRFSELPAYAFPRLRALLAGIEPGGPVIDMTIGEPRHAMPDFVAEVMAAAVPTLAKYPKNEGTEDLLTAISGWIDRRYGVTLGPDRLMALNGTREGLFNAAIALCPETVNGQQPAILMPNPFYQVYAVAALTAGAEPIYVPATAETGFLPDFASIPAETLDRTAIVYLCSPANPQGAVASRDYWRDLLALAERHDFRIFSDDCYSEIWRDTPPPGGLEMAQETGADPERVVVFNSLSKRSNLPGLRAGFVAAGPQSMQRLRQLRAYSGAPLATPLQAVAARAWADEAHVQDSLALYHRKFALAEEVLGGMPGYAAPEAGFFLWIGTSGRDAEDLASRLWRETGVKVLPGNYFSRSVNGTDPGAGYLRAAMVAHEDDLREGLMRLRSCMEG
ncbi:aspartate aminotransferase [Pacificitalea manganoxidans]|uniref:Aminotransferase n=1 Tax=Pacificitalea manganoxidans TaxID=1411902 RepID=A0A291LVB7_9RHOB|nr:aminotransferase class I/II-fold pyridoxal phosphate-dependent enzyme [Pacificitalea manganoxidans]ATI40594.1 aspartate aminotransferase [Pacificitalea manganoxidans]MDR6309580.1 aspartate/methionine/tyrosine aminotransferase [Pacificitalea manganoxidans]